MQFVLALTEERSPLRSLTALHLVVAFVLCGIGGSSFVLYWFTYTSPKFHGAYLPFALLGAACLLAGIVIFLLTVFARSKMAQFRYHLILRIIEIILLGGSAVAFGMQHWRIPAGLFGILAGILVIALFAERRLNNAAIVRIDETGIQFPAKRMPWEEIDSLLLRFGTLTVERAGNHISQRNVADPDFEPEWLETFAQQQIEKHRQKRTADW